LTDISCAVNSDFQNSRRRRVRRHWWAWIGLCATLAIHVVDEALTDFLAVYNPAVLTIREQYPSLPLPTFTFETWLALLIFAVVALVAASFFVWRGRWAMRPISHVFAIVMLLNGLLHIAWSIYAWKLMPGVYSSPLLLVASVALIVYTRAHNLAAK
jgi:hypothetical protein